MVKKRLEKNEQNMSVLSAVLCGTFENLREGSSLRVLVIRVIARLMLRDTHARNSWTPFIRDLSFSRDREGQDRSRRRLDGDS